MNKVAFLSNVVGRCESEGKMGRERQLLKTLAAEGRAVCFHFAGYVQGIFRVRGIFFPNEIFVSFN